MNFSSKLPQNKKEFALFMTVISVISVNIIAPLITCFESVFGFLSGRSRFRQSLLYG